MLCIFHLYASSTLKFIENKGQWPKNVLYRADLPGGKLFAEHTKLTYVFYNGKQLAELSGHAHNSSNVHPKIQHRTEFLLDMHAFEVQFMQANACRVVPSVCAQEYYNFYLGNDPSHWASEAKAYSQLLYSNIYNSIDLKLYQQENHFKYEFILKPGATLSSIKLRYSGLSDLKIDKHGNLLLKTTVNTIVEKAPYIYQIINGNTKNIPGRFVLKDSVVTFQLLRDYNPMYELVIDPQLIFSTYSGSTADNWGNTATNDRFGNMYSGGTVFGVGFPSTLGAYQINYGGASAGQSGVDVGILKFNTTGTALLYATYLGGSFTDVPYSLVVDRNDNLIIMGTTSSLNFPISTGAYDNTFNGGLAVMPVVGILFNNGSDIFISKLNANGSALLASTYIGGTNNDGIQYDGQALTKNYGDEMRGDVTVDSLDNIYVACHTFSVNFPVSAMAFQPANAGGKEACIFKFNPDLSSLLWSTYLGGSGEDAAYSIQVDSAYNVYVAGGTNSMNFPTTSQALHETRIGGIDAFVAHISSDGQTLLHSTYTGTLQYDQAYFVQLDSLQNVYLLGQTQGPYPVSAGVYNNPNSGIFVHALTPTLDSTLYSTVVGKGGFQPGISPTAFLINDCGNIFISGWGGMVNQGFGFIGGNTFGFPVTPDALRTTSDGSDFYIMVLSAGARELLYGTYFGVNDPTAVGDHVDGGTSRFDKKGVIYEAVCGGCMNNDNFPTTPGAWSRTNNSFNCNNAAFKLDLSVLDAKFTAQKSPSCDTTIVNVNNTTQGGLSFFWDFGDGYTTTQINPPPHIYSAPGNYTITLIATDRATCIGTDTFRVSIFIPATPPITFNTLDTIKCPADSVQLISTYNPTYTYSWTPAHSLNNANVHNPISYTTTNTVYHVAITDTNNCRVEKDIRVRVHPIPEIDAGNNQVICPNGSTYLEAKGEGTFLWDYSPYLSCLACQKTKVQATLTFNELFAVTMTDQYGCKNRDTVRVRTKPLPSPILSIKGHGRCLDKDFVFESTLKNLDYECPYQGQYYWNFGDGKTSNEAHPTHQYEQPGYYVVSAQYTYSNIAKDTVLVLSPDSCLKNVFIPNTFTPNGDGVNDFVFLRTINAKKILLRIFNRWGEEVFRTESLHEGWDGTYKGVPQTPQTFVYKAEVTFYDDEHRTLEGNITLLE